jgi:hypothetical protein
MVLIRYNQIGICRMAKYVEKAMNRVPATLTVGVKKFFCGPESFTPDLAVSRCL